MPAALVADPLQDQLVLLERRFAQRVVTLASGPRIAVREAGQRGRGTSFVLLHGISSGAASWLQVADRLADRAHVIAWDAPGYGQSTPLPVDALGALDYAQRLHELLQALEVYRCVLVGHSLGALMADAYVRGPAASRVQRLVLISPAAGYGAPDHAAAQARVRQQRHDALRQLGVPGMAARIDQRLLSPAAGEAQRQWVRWNAARLNPQGYLQAVELLCLGRLGAGATTAVPIDVHCGEADEVTPPQACAAVAQRLGATCRLIAGAGHASPTEQPDAVAQLLLAGA